MLPLDPLLKLKFFFSQHEKNYFFKHSKKIFDEGFFSDHTYVKKFEQAFKKKYNCKYTLATSSGNNDLYKKLVEEALKSICKIVNKKRSEHECSRAILVGHNAHFDLSFLQTNLNRYQIKNSPFHPFSVIDTVTLGAAFTGQTVLARIAKELNINYDNDLAHSASYDAEITAKIFCILMNRIESN